MGNSESVWWVVVECACRILGVSTATVLFAVGVETLLQGEFTSLGIYLVVSSVGIMMFELAYFLDTLLFMCLPCPPDWQLFVLWGKMARIGGFHKFLYYSIMSVVCFLHPVLVWHAIIPGIAPSSPVHSVVLLFSSAGTPVCFSKLGTRRPSSTVGAMLLVTALFNFILSKKTKVKSPKRPQQESHGDQGPTTICVTEGAASNSTVSFFHTMTGSRGGGLALATRDRCLGPGERGESVQAMLELELEQTEAPKGTDGERRRRRWRERKLICLRGREEPVEREMEEMDGYCEPEPDTTSDTAPMITD